MVNVAIAGGTGAVGRAFVEILSASAEHRYFILTRKAPEEHDAQTLQVDYTNVESLQKTLEEHNIHTVISAFGINQTSLATSQLNLIKAADASLVTKRFIPSSFAIAYPKDGVSILPPLEHYFTSLDALKASSLEWAVVHNGTFLEYFAPPTLKTYHPHSTLVIDMENNCAAIPGDGNMPVTFTYTFDVARFVVAALDLPEWPRELRIIGDELTFNEFVALAEEAKGVKFKVSYDSIEKLEASTITELPGHIKSYPRFPKERLQWFLAIFELWMAKGDGRVSNDNTLNEKFPDIKPLSAKEMLETYWKKTA